MKITQTDLKGLLIIEPDIFKDDRGYFFESFNKTKYHKIGIPEKFVQDNESKSRQGVIRGLHYQIGENAQGKLVRVVSGKILDVAVDIRFGSPTFGQYVAMELTAEDFRQFWIPTGFAHGFSVLSDEAIVNYKCTEPYSKQAERGIIFNDPTLEIDWRISKQIVSQKDLQLPRFKEIKRDFIYE